MSKTVLVAALGCLSAILTSTAVLAQVETTPIPLPAKPDFHTMSFLVGTWNCTETNTRRATPYTSTFTTSMDPSGYWMITKTTSQPAAFDPTPTVSEDRLTYDAGTSRWVDVYTDDRGAYGASYSKGWVGGKQTVYPLSFQASVTSGNVVGGEPTVVTKVSDTKYTYAGAFKEKSGRRITLKGTCTKS